MDDDRTVTARSIANLWTAQTVMLQHVMLAIRDSGGLSSEQLDWHLQQMDVSLDVLDGEDDRHFATEMVASVRSALRNARR
jgi:hypothetical protein